MKKKELKKRIAHLEKEVDRLEDEMCTIYHLSERARQSYLTSNGIGNLIALKDEMAKGVTQAMAGIPFCGLHISGPLPYYDALKYVSVTYDLEPEDILWINDH